MAWQFEKSSYIYVTEYLIYPACAVAHAADRMAFLILPVMTGSAFAGDVS